MAYKIRAHQKSRQGCQGCKARHVKCDEAKPRCAGCLRRGIQCIYLTTLKRKAGASTVEASRTVSRESREILSQPKAPCDTPYALSITKNLLDLRLMHQYCIFTAQYFAATFPEEVSRSLKIDIPRLAFKHQFLMDVVLFVAIVHLSCGEQVTLEDLPVSMYRDQALGGLRRAVTETSSQNMVAIRGGSVLLATVSFAADRVSDYPGLWVVNWLTFALGQRNFRRARGDTSPLPDDEHAPSFGSSYGSFDDITGPTAVPTGILSALNNAQDSIDSTQLDTLYKAARDLGRLIAALSRPYEQSWLEKKVKCWSFDVVPPEFLSMSREEKPLALVILAHYLVLFKLLPDLWVYEGLVEHDIEVIDKTLDEGRRDYIALPKAALQIDDQSALVALLVGSLGDSG